MYRFNFLLEAQASHFIVIWGLGRDIRNSAFLEAAVVLLKKNDLQTVTPNYHMCWKGDCDISLCVLDDTGLSDTLRFDKHDDYL